MSDSVEIYGITAAVLLTVVVVAWLAVTDRMRIPEERYPREDDGSVNLALYRKSAKQYWTMYNEYLDYLDNDERQGRCGRSGLFRTTEGAREWSKGTHAIHGLVAQGAGSIPYAIELLGRADPGERDTGALILKRMHATATIETGVVHALEDALAQSSEGADEPPYIDSLVNSLDDVAGIRSQPILVQIAKDTSISLDTRYHCIAILGRIARQNFGLQPDPVEAISAWYQSHQANANVRQDND